MPARRKLERREVLESIKGWSCTSDSAFEWLQDLRSYRDGANQRRRTRLVVHRPGLRALLRGRRRPGNRAPTFRGRSRSLLRAHTRNPKRFSNEKRTTQIRFHAAIVADDHPANAQGLDMSERSGRDTDRGHVPCAPGSSFDRLRESGTFADARSLDA